VAIPVVIEWRAILDTFALALHDDQYTHILLIIPVSATLIYLDRRWLGQGTAPGVGLGLVLLCVSVLVAGWSVGNAAMLSPDVRRALAILALVTWWLGGFVVLFGAQTFQRFVFPLCFLFWLVPFPEFVLNRIVSWLQHGSADAAQLLFAAARVPVVQDGIVMSVPGVTIEVAAECSSIRSSLMLVVISMVVAHLFLRSSWRKAAVVLFAVPLSIAKNGFRIFVIVMLGTRVDPGFLHGDLHRHGGPVFLALALAVIVVLTWLLRRGEGDSAAPNARAAARPGLASNS